MHRRETKAKPSRITSRKAKARGDREKGGIPAKDQEGGLPSSQSGIMWEAVRGPDVLVGMRVRATSATVAAKKIARAQKRFLKAEITAEQGRLLTLAPCDDGEKGETDSADDSGAEEHVVVDLGTVMDLGARKMVSDRRQQSSRRQRDQPFAG